MKPKRTALLLNAFVLPGLGQLYLGRKLAGGVIILLTNLLLLLALLVFFKGLAPVLATRMISGSFNPNELAAALQSFAGFGLALLTGLAILWIYSVVDILINSSGEEPVEAP